MNVEVSPAPGTPGPERCPPGLGLVLVTTPHGPKTLSCDDEYSRLTLN
jgi:hypothetical protein